MSRLTVVQLSCLTKILVLWQVIWILIMYPSPMEALPISLGGNFSGKIPLDPSWGFFQMLLCQRKSFHNFIAWWSTHVFRREISDAIEYTALRGNSWMPLSISTLYLGLSGAGSELYFFFYLMIIIGTQWSSSSISLPPPHFHMIKISMFLIIVLGPRIGMPHTSLVMAVPQWWTLAEGCWLTDVFAASAFEFWPLLNGIVLARENRGVSTPSSPVCIGRGSYILHKCKMGHITGFSYCGILIEAMDSLQSLKEKTNPYSLFWVWSHDSTVEKSHLPQAKARHRTAMRVGISNTLDTIWSKPFGCPGRQAQAQKY